MALCNETMLFDMVVKGGTHDESIQNVVRACVADYDDGVKTAFVADESKASLCTTANRLLKEVVIYTHQPQVKGDSVFFVNHLLSAGVQIYRHLALQDPSCTNNAIEFAYSQSASIGLFSGAEIHQHGITADVLSKFVDYAQARAISKTTILQVCAMEEVHIFIPLTDLILPVMRI
jgi:hypothetical protein